MDHSKHSALSTQELTPEILQGAIVYGVDDQKLGTVSHVHGSGAAIQVVIALTSFLGLGAKAIAMPLQNFEFMRDQAGNVHARTGWTKQQMLDMPEHHH